MTEREVWIVFEGTRAFAYQHEENARSFHADVPPDAIKRYVPAESAPARTATYDLLCLLEVSIRRLPPPSLPGATNEILTRLDALRAKSAGEEARATIGPLGRDEIAELYESAAEGLDHYETALWDELFETGRQHMIAFANKVRRLALAAAEARGAASAIGRAGETEAVWAVAVLDAWAEKHEEATYPGPTFHRYMHSRVGSAPVKRWIVLIGATVEHFETATAARVALARALCVAELEGWEHGHHATPADLIAALLAMSADDRIAVMQAMPDKSLAVEERKRAESAERQAEELRGQLERVKGDIAAAVEALELTRWDPNGSMTEWAKTREGTNHAEVSRALDALRATAEPKPHGPYPHEDCLCSRCVASRAEQFGYEQADKMNAAIQEKAAAIFGNVEPRPAEPKPAEPASPPATDMERCERTVHSFQGMVRCLLAKGHPGFHSYDTPAEPALPTRRLDGGERAEAVASVGLDKETHCVESVLSLLGRANKWLSGGHSDGPERVGVALRYVIDAVQAVAQEQRDALDRGELVAALRKAARRDHLQGFAHQLLDAAADELERGAKEER